MGKLTGGLALKILDGANAAELPVLAVEISTPVFNTDVAAQLGLEIPEAYADAEKVTTAE